MIGTDFWQNAFACIDLAVLFGVTIGVGDWLRGQGQDLTHERVEHHGLQDLMGIPRLFSRPFVGQTTGTADMLGRKVL